MSLVLPTLSGAEALEAYDQRTQLDGVEYLFSFRYNLRRELWTFSIDALDGRPILTGQTVHVGIPLGRRAVRGPPGIFLAISETDDLASPGLGELGARVKLCYLTAAEVAELEAA
jgi:hypothetical protein